MKKSELMLGGIVSIRGNEAKRLKVNAITKKKIQFINERKQPEYLRYSQLVPVPLNNIILEDLGFERRKVKLAFSERNDYILVLQNKKDENEFYTVTIQPDEDVCVNGYRTVHIDDNRYSSVGFGYAKDMHELQSIIQSTTKMCLDTKKILECGKD